MIKQKTFCTRIWNEVFINEDGSVYSCCHNKPEAFGNIYERPLTDIINNKQIQKQRQDSLNGLLSCYKHCSLLSETEKNEPVPNTTEINYKNLFRLKILFGEGCNINCIMCWQDSKSRRVLDVDKLLQNVDLTPFSIIDIQGGEPLFIKNSRIFFDKAIALGKTVNLLTNGTIMNKTMAEQIATSSSFIYFSLNSASPATHEIVNKGSKWQKVMDNIQLVKEARERLRSPLVIHGHFTIIPENCTEIAQFINEFQRFGFDEVDFGYDSKFPTYLKMNSSINKKLKQDIAMAYKDSPLKNKINTNRLQQLGFISGKT